MATKTKKNRHHGSTLEDWLHDEGIPEEVKAEADRRIRRWQLEEKMKRKAMPPKPGS